ncbi:MAG: trehalase family glycosidase, partial [Muribaculaceae bacterium]
MTPITKLLFLALMITTTTEAFGQSTDATKVDEFIRQNMPKTVRVCHTDTVANFGLPYPYSVPCITGAFQNMYYWDTFFTNKGLLQIGDVEQAKNNIDNILAMIERFGYMPNATHTALLNRSQPPYASMMVRDLYEATHDKQWLAGAVATLEKEYRFWMTERVAPNGLNRYGHNATRDELIGFCYGIAGRLGIDAGKFADDDAREKAGAHWLAEAESGWDFNPRYDQRCMDFNPVDLNANLYVYETN